MTTPEHRRHWAVALLFITPALWSVNYLVARASADVIAPHMLAFWRWSLAGAMLAGLARRDIWSHRDAVRREWKQLLVLGALGMWICGAFVYVGGRTTTATNISLIYALSPLLIAVASTRALGERLGPIQIAGIGLSLVGFCHVVLTGKWGSLASVQLNPGDWWILSAAVSWAAYTLLMKRWPSSFGPTARLALVAAAGVGVLLPFTIVEALFIPSEVSWRSGGFVIATAVFPAFGAYPVIFVHAQGTRRVSGGCRALPRAGLRCRHGVARAGRAGTVYPLCGRGADYARHLVTNRASRRR